MYPWKRHVESFMLIKIPGRNEIPASCLGSEEAELQADVALLFG